jgi:metal-dependent amidase/aminoacylase/carboxypeptidase family protein
MTDCETEITLRPGGGLHAHKWSETMESMSPNLYLAELMYENFKELEVNVEDWRITARLEPGGGTDFSNVTRHVPGLHPSISISKEKLPGHNVVLARATTSEEGHKALVNGTKVLAMTATEIFTEPRHLKNMKSVHLMDIDEYLVIREEININR